MKNKKQIELTSEIFDMVADFCENNFHDELKKKSSYGYPHLALCVVDAVYSIGAKYGGVVKVIDRTCKYLGIDKFDQNNPFSISDFLSVINELTPESLSEKVFKNRQRTSTRNGILKSEAVLKFVRVLKNHSVETIQDIRNLDSLEKLEDDIRKIEGQKSGISFKYFLMLTGYENLIKPDRMIQRFLLNVTEVKGFSLDNCQRILETVNNILVQKGYNCSPRKLDHIIWDYQRIQKRKSKLK